MRPRRWSFCARSARRCGPLPVPVARALRGSICWAFRYGRGFWNIWHSNIGKIPEIENTRYYIEQYYIQVLSQIDIEDLLKDENDPILLCYEKGQEFCHRHVLAEYIELIYGTRVRDIKIDEQLNVEENIRPRFIRKILEEVVKREEEVTKRNECR